MPHHATCILALAAGLLASCATAPREASALDQFLAAHPPPELTGQKLPTEAAPADRRLLVLGHAYGQHGRWTQGDFKPSPSLVANTKRLTALNPDLVVSLGDFIESWHPKLLEPAKGFFRELGPPVLNAVGNHDAPDRFEAKFGNTWGGLRLGRYLLLVVNTEEQIWSLSPEQVSFMERALSLATEEGVDRVLVFGHKVIFSVDRPRYLPLVWHVNAHDGWSGDSNFNSQVRPLLEGFIQTGGQAYWFAGDIGTTTSFGLFFDRDPLSGITFVCTGVGGQVWDNALAVQLGQDGEVGFEVLSLTEEPLQAIDTYGPAFWSAHFER